MPEKLDASSEDEFEFASEVVDHAEVEINFLDIELPSPEHFQSSEWRDDRYDIRRYENGCTYEGMLHGEMRNGPGKLYDDHRSQYVDGKWQNDCLVEFDFAQFQLKNANYFRLNGIDDLITSNKYNFVARIIKEPISIKSNNFRIIRKEIESKITIVKILDDDLKNKLNESRVNFKQFLIAKQEMVSASRSAQRDMFHLYLLMEEIDKYNSYQAENQNCFLLNKIIKNTLFSQELRNEASGVFDVEEAVITRNNSLPIMQLRENAFTWRKVIKECIKHSINCIRRALINALPTRVFIYSGLNDLNNLKDRQLITCSVYDIKLFSDLEITIGQYLKIFKFDIKDFVELYIGKLWALLIKKIESSFLNYLCDKSLYTDPLFLQLFKTFLELLHILCNKNNTKVSQIVSVGEDGSLHMTENPREKLTTPEKRLEFLLTLMNHFKPGDSKNFNYNYKFSFFKVNKNIIKRFWNYVADKFDNSLSNIPQEYIVWLYYVHKSFQDLFCEKQREEESSNENDLFMFLNSLMNLFKTVIKNHEISLEKVRILASSIIKFGTTISPYFLEETIMNKGDLPLLLKQTEYIIDFVTVDDSSLDDLTNIVDIYQVFWDERKNLLTELRNRNKLWLSPVDKLISKLNTFTEHIFDLRIHNNKCLIFLRSYNEFIRFLRGTNYPWYVKEENLVSKEFVEIVDESKHSYLVTNTENFLKKLTIEKKTPPRHYLLDVAVVLITYGQEFLNSNNWNENDKMQACSDLFLLMSRSLINFNKLPNAVDFEKFFADFTEPFRRVTKNSTDLNDFKKRLGSLESYYTYTMELNVMSVGRALELARKKVTTTSQIDYDFDSTKLGECYNVYLEKFNTYVHEYLLQTNIDINELVKTVKSKTKSKDISQWDSEYKSKKLPKILAGLSAIWSALESKDVISQKQLIKPHCIQILCILRLLGVDQTHTGLDGHLAQVLTGQGKSIVLSLLAAILSLTGNRVRIVCYNEYLATRDKESFQTFYQTFGIENEIKYGTFQNMADEILEPKIKDSKYDLRKFVRELVTGQLPKLYVKEEDKLVGKTVLLIDEVDVFFSPEYYGNTYNLVSTIRCETLADLQLKLWNLTDSNCNETDLRENMRKYIDDTFAQSTDQIFINLVNFSRNLLNTHVEKMISDAVAIRNCSPGDWYYKTFKLRDDDGRIITIKDDGEHTTRVFYSYCNIFMYFKLKNRNFDHKNLQNYGYLSVNCGSISYAMLPNDYRTILGVTGTLKQLSNAELNAVTSYKIKRGSDMPTFFGDNKLRIKNFTIKNTIDEWIKCILENILDCVEGDRAVLVFFEDEQTIDLVREKFGSHLSRYSVLTGNEGKETVENCVDEAGVAKRITIATKRMGRGVDFKSNDSTVESKGGIHVIQTFFSEDIKEETQIKGRTARKDNNGSYELILCREHLQKLEYCDSADSYSSLNHARAQRSQNKGIEIATNVEKSQQKHEATMKFLQSFFHYDPKNRNEYFQKYPFVALENN